MLSYGYKEMNHMKKLIFSLLICSIFLTGCTENPDSVFTPLGELPSDYTVEEAKDDGCVIIENGDVTSGQNFWDSFVEQTRRSDDAYVRYCHYYTIEDPSRYAPEYYEEIKADYPKIYVHDLSFDGDTYTDRYFEGDNENVREYKYLMKYEDAPESEWATYVSCTRYVLTNDNTVTWDDITRSMYSSLSISYIDHLTVYCDYVYKDE